MVRVFSVPATKKKKVILKPLHQVVSQDELLSFVDKNDSSMYFILYLILRFLCDCVSEYSLVVVFITNSVFWHYFYCYL